MDLWDRQKERRQSPPTAQPAPWQGISEIAQSLGINLGELWRTREQELKAAREAADATSKELHELRLREIDNRVLQLQAIADKTQLAVTQPPQGHESFLEKLDKITDGLVTKRIAGLFGGDNNQSQPKDPVDEFFHRLDQVEKVKERFGNPGGGGAQALAQSGIRGELLKLLLEDERERLKMQYDHETQVERNKHLGVLATTVKENLSDGIQALTAAASEIKKTGVSSPAKQEEAQPQAFACSCGMKFSAPAGWAGQPLKCPNPNCGREYTKEELLS